MPAIATRNPLPLQPRVCAWCDCPMGVEAPALAPTDSRPNHGLCADCIQDLLDSLHGPVEPRPTRCHRAPRVTRRVAAR